MARIVKWTWKKKQKTQGELKKKAEIRERCVSKREHEFGGGVEDDRDLCLARAD